MEFRILGPLEVFDDEGRPVPVHRGKEQALLAYLLLHPNELVPSDRLIDELWGERPPATAVAEQPLPSCSVTTRVSSSGRETSSAWRSAM